MALLYNCLTTLSETDAPPEPSGHQNLNATLHTSL